MTLALALVGNFDTVLGAWREAGGASFDARPSASSAPPRAPACECELAEEAADYADELGEQADVGDGGCGRRRPALRRTCRNCATR